MRTLIAMCLCVVLSGCFATAPIQTVVVDKPVVMCPKPPAVPALVSRVDQLTEADAKTPGVVGEAYKYDMTYLRTMEGIYRMILEEYSKTSQSFDAVNAEIDKAFANMQSPKQP